MVNTDMKFDISFGQDIIRYDSLKLGLDTRGPTRFGA